MHEAVLGTVSTVLMGQSPPGDTCNSVGDGLPLLNGPTEFGSHHPEPAQWTTDGRRICKPGAVLLCVRGSTTGRMNHADQVYAIGRGIAAIESDDEIDQKFLFYVLADRLNRLLETTTGSVFPNLSRQDIVALVVPWPDRNERHHIVSLLGSIDDKIEMNHQSIRLEEELATLLVDQAPKRVPLHNVAAVQRLTINPASSGATLVDHFSLPAFDDRRLPVRQSGAEIMSGKFRIDDISILVSKLNPHIPRVWYAVPETGVLGVASTEFVVMTPLGGVTHEELWACCNTAAFTSSLVEAVTGTTGSHQRVHATDVLSIEVGDPISLSPGQRLSITTMVRSAYLLRNESVALATLRNTLLTKLLNGELHVRGAESFAEEAV